MDIYQIACCIMGAVLFAALVAWGMSYVFAVRKYELGVGNALSAIGMPAWLTQGFFTLGTGDHVKGFDQLEAAADRLATVSGLAEVDLGYVSACRANPARWPAFFKLVNDAANNASQQQLQSDATALAQTRPLTALGNVPTPAGVLAADVSSFASQLAQSATASQALADHPQLQSLHNTISANPALAPQLGTVMAVASAAASHTKNALAAPPAAAAPAVPTGTSVTASNVLPGHVVTVSATPGSPAAAAAAAS